MCIAIVCFPGCDVINFEIKLILLIKPFYMTKESSKKLKHLRTKRAFNGEKIAFFIIFKMLSVAKNCPKTDSALLIKNKNKCTEKFYRNCLIENGSI